MLRIGVISDTHLTRPTRDLEALVTGPFKDAEMILHAGDMTELQVLDAFSGKKVIAVCGNMDSSMVRKEFPTHRVFSAGSFKIGLIHGWGGPQGIEERITREFDGVDGIVYGHTHTASWGERGGIFYLNPGAFGAGRSSASSKSVAVLTLGEAIAAEIIHL